MDVIKNAGRRSAIMSKVEDILASTKVGDVLDAAKLNKFLKRQEEEEKKPSKFVIVFAVIGIVVAVAAAIYGIYRFRSEERRVGQECSEPCRSRWSPYH